MIRLFALLALLVSGVAIAPVVSAQPIPGAGCPRNASPCPVTATGGTTARTLANRTAQVLNVKDGANGVAGAVGDGVTDDSAAFVAVINRAVTLDAAGTAVIIYMPAANYLINVNALPTATRGISFVGDGSHKTYITIGASYSGDLFSWSEAWQGSAYVNPLTPAADKAGPTVQGVTVLGNTSSAAEQNAFVFYDRNDHVRMEDVEVYFLNGRCLSIGRTKNQTQAYMRESVFYGIKCWNTGTASNPAVEISSTTTNGSDSTNELQFFKLHIFAAAGKGLVIRNPNNFNSTRLLEFFAPRVEQSGADNIDVGLAADAGLVTSVRFYGLESLSPGAANSGFYGMNIDNGQQMYDIFVLGGQIGPCFGGTCKGVNINNARLTKIQVENITTTGTNVTLGSSLGTSVVIDGNGQEQNWTYAIDSSVAQKILSPVLKQGDPSSSSGTTNPPAVVANQHDGTAAFGNQAGAGAVDLQTARNANTQVAALPGSVLIGGAFNAVAGNGSQGGIVGGSTNLVTGNSGFIGGGGQALDRGRTATQTFSAGHFLTNGDAQVARFVLRQITTSNATGRLTADMAAAGSANVVNISNSFSYGFRAQCVARDITTAGTDLATTMPVALLSRDANVASTAIVLGTPASVSRGTFTGGSFAFTADTTNGGLNITFTPPTSNNDTFHSVCEILDAEGG